MARAVGQTTLNWLMLYTPGLNPALFSTFKGSFLALSQINNVRSFATKLTPFATNWRPWFALFVNIAKLYEVSSIPPCIWG
jgi:hypothetical protein